MQISRVGIDLAKQVFEVCGVDQRGRVRLRKTLRRSQVCEFMSRLEPCLVGMEACAGAHYWARELTKLGHDVRLISPQFVRPYRKNQKNDRNDAEAIAEAVGRPNMHFVPIKTDEQQAVLAMHGARRLAVAQRTAAVNQAHGQLLEYGIASQRSVGKLRALLPAVIEDAESSLPSLAREVLAELYERIADLDSRVTVYDRRIAELAKSIPEAKRLMAVPGIGPVTATAVVASVCDARAFANGRQFAAWLGLVPRQYSTGGKPRLGRITKRGDVYLRTLLVHGARARMRTVSRGHDPRGPWIEALKHRRGHNKAAVALAAHHARILWAMMARGVDYEPMRASIA